MTSNINYLEFCDKYGFDLNSDKTKEEYKTDCVKFDFDVCELTSDLDKKTTDRKHGGEREGAGRPALRGETVVKRIPARYKLAVEALIKHLDETRGQNGSTGYASSVNCRNLNDTLITLQFQSKSKKIIM
ncbi:MULTISPECIES: hypothetical protein [unclassified Pseudoalteromonas]|jgi:hypothetical protein|uniref:hypothetical protein n=1 Tax=unclassified Pseudoalteromonas TaxID=194690 RepID=UPI0004656ED2|nr:MULTISPECIES: hypothetical protein [unclassified Pseudoalteromonas]